MYAIDPATGITADHAVERADDEADEGPRHTDAERDTRTAEQPVKQVLAIQIGAQQMLAAAWREELAVTRRFERLRHQHRPDDGREREKAERVE